MLYMSEITNKTYATEQECLEAEKAYKAEQKAKADAKAKREAAKAIKMKEIDEAYDAAVQANKVYRDKLNDFLNEYGEYCVLDKSYSSDKSLRNVIDMLFQ